MSPLRIRHPFSPRGARTLVVTNVGLSRRSCARTASAATWATGSKGSGGGSGRGGDGVRRAGDDGFQKGSSRRGRRRRLSAGPCETRSGQMLGKLKRVRPSMPLPPRNSLRFFACGRGRVRARTGGARVFTKPKRRWVLSAVNRCYLLPRSECCTSRTKAQCFRGKMIMREHRFGF